MIQKELWLDKAKQVPVGSTVRIKHGRERRLNLVIGNSNDAWWCYCQACKTGDKVMKEHAVLGETKKPPVVYSHPTDLKPLGIEQHRFLCSKGMSLEYLNGAGFTVQYSDKTKRLVLEYNGDYFGRDTTGRSNAKWIHYDKNDFVVLPHVKSDIAVVVEDLFSAAKIRYVNPPYDVVCTLGTGQTVRTVQSLSEYNILIWMYDGDSAGKSGANTGVKRLRPFVHGQFIVDVPDGKDPKDMSCEALQTALKCDNLQWVWGSNG